MFRRVPKAVAVLLPWNGRANTTSAGEQILREHASGKYDYVGVVVFGPTPSGSRESEDV